ARTAHGRVDPTPVRGASAGRRRLHGAGLCGALRAHPQLRGQHSALGAAQPGARQPRQRRDRSGRLPVRFRPRGLTGPLLAGDRVAALAASVPIPKFAPIALTTSTITTQNPTPISPHSIALVAAPGGPKTHSARHIQISARKKGPPPPGPP